MAAPRFGLEVEMHGLELTWKRLDTPQPVFWSSPPTTLPPTPLDSTMIGKSPILVPQDSSQYKANGAPDTAVNWTGDWGLRAVGDAFGYLAFAMDVNTGTAIQPNIQRQNIALASCTLELQTAATEVNNVHYWVFARRCMQAFRNTMGYFANATLVLPDDMAVISTGPRLYDRWFPLDDFLKQYNETVDGIQAPVGFNKNRFKLKVADRVLDLRAGTAPEYPNERWGAFFSIVRPFEIIGGAPFAKTLGSTFSDVQLTYDIDLDILWSNMSGWQGVWASTWINRVRTPTGAWITLDSPNGLERSKQPPTGDTGDVLAYSAVWSAARLAATSFTANVNMTTLPPNGQNIFKSLIALLFATGCINYGGAAASTAKNAFAQLPKSSPASIARALSEMWPLFTPVLQSLSTLTEVNRAVAIWGTEGPKIIQAPQMPPGGLYDGAPDWSNSTGRLKTPLGTVGDHFNGMWKGTFDLAGTTVAYHNIPKNRGFTEVSPFFVPWAPDAKSSKPAARHGPNNMSLKIMVESRHGSMKLNQGFNPYAVDAMFRQSYASLMNLLSPATNVADMALLDSYFPNFVPLLQTFPVRNAGGTYMH